ARGRTSGAGCADVAGEGTQGKGEECAAGDSRGLRLLARRACGAEKESRRAAGPAQRGCWGVGALEVLLCNARPDPDFKYFSKRDGQFFVSERDVGPDTPRSIP